MNNTFKYLQSRYINLFLGPVDARIYSIFRIGFALVSLVNLLDLWPDRESLFTDAGMLNQEYLAKYYRWPYVTVFYYFRDATSVTIIMLISALSMVFLLLGVKPRLAALVVYVWYVSYSARSTLAMGGWDLILRTLSFFVLICPLPKCWSLGGGSALLNKTEIVPKYGLTLIRIQVLTIYWQTVLDRMDTSFWWNGEFMGYFFLSHNSRWPMIWIADYELLLQVSTYLVIAVEIMLPILLMVRRWHRAGFIIGFLLHGGIVLTAYNLGMFFLTMMALYLSFLRQEDLEWITERIQRLSKIKHLPNQSR